MSSTAYHFFLRYAGYGSPMGATAAQRLSLRYANARSLAAAEREARERDLAFLVFDEEEPWDGECEAPDVLVNVAVYEARDLGEGTGMPLVRARCLAALGMIGLESRHDPYLRIVKAELAREALDLLASERDSAERSAFTAGG